MLLVGALALAGGLLAWLSLGGTAPPAPPGLDDEPRAEQPANASEHPAIELAAVDGTGFEDFVAADELERSEVLIDVDPVARLVLQVWDRKRGEVAAEADVFVLEGFDGPELDDPFGPHWCELARLRGRRYKATTEGRVELPRLGGRALVAAELPGAVGFRVLNAHHGEREEITLRPDESVTVRVVDGDGRPVANVPVGIQQRLVERVDTKRAYREFEEAKARVDLVRAQLKSQPARAAELGRRLASFERRYAEAQKTVVRIKQNAVGKGKADGAKVGARQSGKPQAAAPLVDTRYDVRARRRTDEQGYAVFRHFQFYRFRQAKWWPRNHRDRFDAVLMIPLVEPVRQPFRGRPMPEEAIVLQMPPTGVVALRTIDRDGRPFTHPVRGDLRIHDGRNPAWTRLMLRKEQDEREVVFEHVGLGVQLFADCRLDDDDFRWRSPVFRGPERAGERKTVDLVVAPDAAMLYGRVLDQGGTPLGSRELTFLINSARGRLEGEEVVLDDEGRFHLPYHVRGQHAPPFRLQLRHEQHAQVPGLARTLAALPSEGVTDLGDLQVGLLQQVAFGRVVDDLGEPVTGAHVQLQRERRVGRNGDQLRFQDEAFTDAHSDENGDFWLFGDVEAARYRLRVRADGYFPEETPNINAVTGSEIRLTRRARLVGTVLLPDWIQGRRVRVRLESQQDPEQSHDGRIHDTRGKHYVYFDWVRPGIYNLSLRIHEFPEPFLRIDNLEVRAGDRDPHPRLRDLDLGQHLFRFEVFAVDEAGQRLNPKSPLLARITSLDGSSRFVGFSWRGGRVEIVNSQPSLEVSPFAPGFRARAGVLAAGRSEIRFLRVPPIALHAPGVRAIVGGTNVWIGLQLIGAPDVASLDGRTGGRARQFRRMTSSYGRLGADERADVSPLMDGRYRVTAYIGDKGRGGLVEVPMGEVDVRVVAGGPRVTLAVQAEPQALHRAMQDLAQRQAAAAANPGGK